MMRAFLFAGVLALFSAGAMAQSDPDELVVTAQRAFDDGFHDVAIKYLKEFIADYPQHPKINQARMILGQCYFFKNNYLQALKLFDAVGAANDNQDMVLFWLAETQLKLGNLPQAREKYRELLKGFPSSPYVPQALYSLGWSYFDAKDYAQASPFFLELAARFPRHQLCEDALEKSAECLYNTGDYEGAVKSFEAYLKAYPQSQRQGQVRLNIADALYYAQDYQQAALHYELAAKAAPADAQIVQAANAGMIWSAVKRKMYDQAKRLIREAADYARSKGLSQENILLAGGQMSLEKGDMPAAVNAFSALIHDYPGGENRLTAYLGRANAYYDDKKYAQARLDFQFVIDHHQGAESDLADKANFGLGWVLVRMGDITAGVRCFQSVYETSPDQETKYNALVQMADAYQEGGRPNDALGIYAQIKKEGKKEGLEDYLQYRMALAFLKAQKYENAQAAFEDLVGRFPASKYAEDVNYYLGVIQFKNNHWTKAGQSMDAFLKSLSHPSALAPQANYILALAYLNQKQCDDALKVFQKILRLYPEEEEIAKNSDIGIAKCQFELGQVKEAVKRFKLIVFKYPRTDAQQEALLWLAQDAMKNFQYPQAVEDYRKLLEEQLDPAREDQVNYELGQAYEVQGALDEALTQYHNVSDRDEALAAKVKLAIAGILSKEFDPQKAIKAYTSIAQNSPDYARDAYLKIALLYRNAQDYAQEIAVEEKALKCGQGESEVSNVELLFTLADTYEVSGRIEEALDEYLKIPTQYPDQTTWVVKAYLRVAKIFEDRHDWEGARVTYQKIVQLNVDESKFAQERLDLYRKK